MGTEDGIYNTTSATWANTKVDLRRSFAMEAQILIDSPTYVGGEGIALVFQTEGTEALGSPGNGRGYQGISGPCVAIDINTHHHHHTHPTTSTSSASTNDDVDDGKISITKNCNPSNVFSQIGSANIGYIKDLRIRQLRVEYDGNLTKQIRVYFDGEEKLSGF